MRSKCGGFSVLHVYGSQTAPILSAQPGSSFSVQLDGFWSNLGGMSLHWLVALWQGFDPVTYRL